VYSSFKGLIPAPGALNYAWSRIPYNLGIAASTGEPL
jgi:hypothetical protein